MRAITGNPVEILEIDHTVAVSRLASTEKLWRDIARDGITVQGLTTAELLEPVHA